MFTLQEIADRFAVELIGEGGCTISGVATLQNATHSDISFLSNARYRKFLGSTQAGAVIVSSSDRDLVAGNGLIVSNPYVLYAKIAQLLYPLASGATGCHPSAVIDPSAIIHESASVGPNVVIAAGARIDSHVSIGACCCIGEGVHIGEATHLFANVTVLDRCILGQRVIIQSGAVIGGDGFGFANEDGKWLKIPQVGRVLIGDDVEVGANTTIDRGAIEDTVIEEGVKLDNLIQIAHNVRIGAHTAIAAGAAIAGSATIGRNCQIAGKVGIVGHLDITDNVTITAMSMVTQSITEAGVYSAGTPLEPNKSWHRNYIRFKQLDEMARRLKQLEKRLDKKQ